ncbi:MAG: hypothetical protein JW976_02155 [Syntrophaceae bacterium]|nr:hypothetical protein [Syntrophaceae bacterium]
MSASKSKSRSRDKNIVSEVIEDVTDFVRTSVFAGLGLVFLGEETIEKWVKDVAKENKLSTSDVKSFIRDVRKQSVEARKDVEKRVKSFIDDILPSSKKKSDGDSKKKSKSKKKTVTSSKRKSKIKKKNRASSKKKSHSDSSERLLIREKEKSEKAVVKDTEATGIEPHRGGIEEEIA